MPLAVNLGKFTPYPENAIFSPIDWELKYLIHSVRVSSKHVNKWNIPSIPAYSLPHSDLKIIF